jgi:hypothetical protein
MVTVFEPTSNGMEALHCVVPAAVPAPPVLVDQVTAATPTVSLDVPLKARDGDDVEMLVDEGELIVSEGGVVSVPVGGAVTGGVTTGGATTGVDARVTLNDCET